MKEIFTGRYFYNLVFWTLLIGSVFMAYFAMNEKKNAVKRDKPVFNNAIVFESSDKMKIRQYSNIFQRHKNKIEKSLEKRAPRLFFTIADCDEIQKTAFACENLFLKMEKEAYSSVNLARIKAANNAARQLILDAAKLKSFVLAKKNRRKEVYSQLSKVEADVLKIDIHLNALLKE
ncbi:MAG: hypothetical protein L6420_03325 [Elusimicrobia bacterium]|nr:hypothetical protein [Elusimicrobiota bacterium]